MCMSNISEGLDEIKYYIVSIVGLLIVSQAWYIYQEKTKTVENNGEKHRPTRLRQNWRFN